MNKDERKIIVMNMKWVKSQIRQFTRITLKSNTAWVFDPQEWLRNL